jgi:hypothetical protein
MVYVNYSLDINSLYNLLINHDLIAVTLQALTVVTTRAISASIICVVICPHGGRRCLCQCW